MRIEETEAREFVAALAKHQRDPRRAYRVVDDFEQELCWYTGAPFAVAVDSCTNALFLSLVSERLNYQATQAIIPKRTYVGVLQAVRNSGLELGWYQDPEDDWQKCGWYHIAGTEVIDSARHLARNIYKSRTVVALSFHAAKQLPLGRGGAILTDDQEEAEWLRAARMDGRPPGAPIEETLPFGAHCPMPPDTAARGLWILSRWNDAGYDPPPLPDETYPDLSVL